MRKSFRKQEKKVYEKCKINQTHFKAPKSVQNGTVRNGRKKRGTREHHACKTYYR